MTSDHWVKVGLADHLCHCNGCVATAGLMIGAVLRDIRQQVVDLQESMYHDSGAVAMANEILKVIDYD